MCVFFLVLVSSRLWLSRLLALLFVMFTLTSIVNSWPGMRGTKLFFEDAETVSLSWIGLLHVT